MRSLVSKVIEISTSIVCELVVTLFSFKNASDLVFVTVHARIYFILLSVSSIGDLSCEFEVCKLFKSEIHVIFKFKFLDILNINSLRLAKEEEFILTTDSKKL